MSEELLPCPCCASESKLTIPNPKRMTAYYIECVNPSCQLQGRMSGSKDKVIAAWNRRTPPEGYVLVPIEPTDEMYQKAWSEKFCDDDGARFLYKAMLSAVDNK